MNTTRQAARTSCQAWALQIANKTVSIFILLLSSDLYWNYFQFSSVQSLSRVRLFATPWIAARQASLAITNSQSSLRLTSIESVMPSSQLILCRPLFLLPSIPPSIRVFSNESNSFGGQSTENYFRSFIFIRTYIYWQLFDIETPVMRKMEIQVHNQIYKDSSAGNFVKFSVMVSLVNCFCFLQIHFWLFVRKALIHSIIDF